MKMQPFLTLLPSWFPCPSANCRKSKKKKKKKKTKVPEAKSNCIHSSNHLSLLISSFSPVYSSIRLSSFLSLQSHPSLCFSITHPLSLLIFCLYLSLPWYHQHFLASVCLFLRSLSLLNTVVSRLLSPSVFLLRAVLSPVPASKSPSWRPAILGTATGCGRGRWEHVWDMYRHTLGLFCSAY